VHSADIDYSPNQEQKMRPPSDFLTQQQNITTSSGKKRYRIHLGTQPWYYTSEHITFEQSKTLHLKMMDDLKNFFTSFGINFKFIREDAFSNSEWGLEPYACISYSCSNEIAKGLAAIIGFAFRQGAIGIYSDNSNDPPHPVFTITSSDNSYITKTVTRRIIEIISMDYKDLSAQFDEHGQELEFHDFQGKYDMKITVQALNNIVNGYFKNAFFQVNDSIGRSSLLEKKDYEEEIKQAGLECLYNLIKMTRLHDESYNKPRSVQKS
jgi:hypothetical protein